MRILTSIIAIASLSACASITNDATVPIALSFSDGSRGTCTLQNKRMTYNVKIPTTQLVRRSDDNLNYNCKSRNGGESVGGIPSSMGAKIVASAVFLDLGIVDSVTDKHRNYPSSFVIPMAKIDEDNEDSED